jgi:N-acetyl-anhydromuramyl-L-alanine amidase AmpD
MTRRASTTQIVIHCSATRPTSLIGAKEIREWHLARGWADIGYHFVIRRDGLIDLGRDLQEIGAHVAGHNAQSIGICLVGGLDMDGNPVEGYDNYTAQQQGSLELLLKLLRRIYPHAGIFGHRDLSPDRNNDGKITRDEWLKACPCFDASRTFASI